MDLQIRSYEVTRKNYYVNKIPVILEKLTPFNSFFFYKFNKICLTPTNFEGVE